jgi:hypothetical protein
MHTRLEFELTDMIGGAKSLYFDRWSTGNEAKPQSSRNLPEQAASEVSKPSMTPSDDENLEWLSWHEGRHLHMPFFFRKAAKYKPPVLHVIR